MPVEKPEQKLQQINEQIAFELSQKADLSWAWVEHDGTIYHAGTHKDYRGPATAITQLIQHLFELKIDHSFFILRKRIFTTHIVTPMCRGMVKLAAKRATGEIEAYDHQLALNFSWSALGTEPAALIESAHIEKILWSAPERIRNLSEAREALDSLIFQIPRGPVLHDHNRAIAVLLCDRDGRILEYSTNSNFKNKTLHAEVTVLQSYYRKYQQILPEESRIYVSLKPCLMCAAMISHLAPDSCRVVYFKDDPGALAQGTELEKRGLLDDGR